MIAVDSILDLDQTPKDAYQGLTPDQVWTGLYDNMRGYIFAIALRSTGHIQKSEDIVQEAYLRAWQHLPRVLACAAPNPRAWLLKVTYRLCTDEANHQTELDQISLNTTIPESDHPEDPQEDRGLSAQQAETRQEVRNTIVSIPERYRTAFTLREYYGLNYEQVAAILGTNFNQTNALLRAGRRIFKANYTKLYPHNLVLFDRANQVRRRAPSETPSRYSPSVLVEANGMQCKLSGNLCALAQVIHQRSPVNLPTIVQGLEEAGVVIGNVRSSIRYLGERLPGSIQTAVTKPKFNEPQIYSWVGSLNRLGQSF